MCTGIEIAMLAMTVVGAGVSVNAAADRASADRVTAHQMELDALAEEAAANERADLVRKAGKKTQENARAAYAAAGVEVGEGSPIVLDQEIAQDVEHDAWSEVLTGRSAARRTRAQAGALRSASHNYVTQAALSGAGSILSSGAQAYRSGWSTQPQPQQAAAPIESRYVVNRALQINPY